MDLLQEAKQGRRVFKITFPSGESIRFCLLSWRDFKMYDETARKGTIPGDLLEDSIFRQCVLDQDVLEEMPETKAGIVSTVVGIVMAMSGPSDIDTFNNTMDLARQQVDTLDSQIVMIICRAFPGYTPDDVLEMPWAKVLTILAQAERILLSSQQLQEPIMALPPEEMQKQLKQQGKVNVEELVQDARKLQNPDFLGPAEGQRRELTPRQQDQLRRKEIIRRRVKGR